MTPAQRAAAAAGGISQISPPPNWSDLIDVGTDAGTVNQTTGKVSLTSGRFVPDDAWAIWFQQVWKRLQNGWLVPVHEVPTGTIDGTNKVFSLTYAPLNGWLVLHLDNALEDPVIDYNLDGNKITYTTAPQPSDTHHAWYFAGIVASTNPSAAAPTSVWTPRTAGGGTAGGTDLSIQVWDTTAVVPANYTAVLTKPAPCDLLAVLVALNGSPTFVQGKSAASTLIGGSSISITFDSPNTAGNLLLLDVGFYWSGADTGVTVTDTAGNTWTALIQPLAGHMGVFEVRTCNAGANTVTVTANSVGVNRFQFPVVAVTEYAPGATTSPDAMANGVNSGASSLTLSVTTTQIVQFLHLACFTGPSGSAQVLALPPPSPPQ